MKRGITLKKNQVLYLMIIGIIIISILLTTDKVIGTEETVSNNGNRAMTTDELKPIVTFLNSRVNNGFVLSVYSSVDDAKLDKIIYNSTKDVTDLVEELEYLKVKSGDKASIQKIDNQISSNQISLKKITMEEIKNFYHEKTGVNLSDEDIKNRLEGSSFVYIESKKAFYTEPTSNSNFLAIQAIEGMATANGRYLVQITSSSAEAGGRSLMYKINGEAIESTTVTLKPQEGTYFIESNEESNDASLLYDHEIYTGYDNLDINDLNYDFEADYISQYENEISEEKVTNNVVVVPKSNVPTALIISGTTVGIIVVLGALIIFINKKYKPKKFDIDNFRYEEREYSDDSVINQYTEEDFDEMEAEIEESEIHNNPANEEAAEREIEALAEARMKGKPIHTALDELYKPKKRGRKPGSKNKTKDK